MDNKEDVYKQQISFLDRADEKIKTLFLQMTNKNFKSDFLLAAGIARRSCALTSGFKAMLKDKNSLCALGILRMQLDNTLRLYAGFFSKDRVQFSEDVLSGKHIRKLMADDNKPMTDNYLARRVSEINPWLSTFTIRPAVISTSQMSILKKLFAIKAGKTTSSSSAQMTLTVKKCIFLSPCSVSRT
ncbi:hypothetical protein [Type-E symbiont of Plautia stali]|uniref:hypothetical protein n=1 Tax=Type-E symbiont of Plautia stali TaxID=1560357 RepID=UPI00073F177E|nr:hypothetical protein [Type-E symbiont of Plautia stali]